MQHRWFRSERTGRVIRSRRQRLGRALPAAAISERAAQRRDDLVEVVLLHPHVRPHRRNQRRLVPELKDALSSPAFRHFPPVSHGFRRSQPRAKASSTLSGDSRLQWSRGAGRGKGGAVPNTTIALRSAHMSESETTTFLPADLAELGLMAYADPTFAERMVEALLRRAPAEQGTEARAPNTRAEGSACGETPDISVPAL